MNAINGQLVDDKRLPIRGSRLFHMLAEETAATDGVWVNVRGYSVRTIQVTGIGVATVEVREATTDLKNKPAPSDQGDIVDVALTADGSLTWNSAATWVKIRVSAYTSGTLNCFLSVDDR